ncbi:translation initiation factor IF-2-like [Camelus ferus]|uniref:Translation initiation factor IF-2-like n=1 Tax=Camelus ferus TaxID=419612 RepID=A0A8B8U9X0_CAMFR|nr:translation initiation factor IF-2-like [Camelus ferus]
MVLPQATRSRLEPGRSRGSLGAPQPGSAPASPPVRARPPGTAAPNSWPSAVVARRAGERRAGERGCRALRRCRTRKCRAGGARSERRRGGGGGEGAGPGVLARPRPRPGSRGEPRPRAHGNAAPERACLSCPAAPAPSRGAGCRRRRPGRSASHPGERAREPEPAAASANLPARRRGGARGGGAGRALGEGAPSRAACSLRDGAECRLAWAMRTAAPTPCQVLVPTSRQPEVLGRQTVGRKLEFPGLAFLTRMNRSIFSPSRAETHLGQRWLEERSHDQVPTNKTSVMKSEKCARRLTGCLPVWSSVCEDVTSGAAAALLGLGGAEDEDNRRKESVSLMLLSLSFQRNPRWSQPFARLPAKGDTSDLIV